MTKQESCAALEKKRTPPTPTTATPLRKPATNNSKTASGSKRKADDDNGTENVENVVRHNVYLLVFGFIDLQLP